MRALHARVARAGTPGATPLNAVDGTCSGLTCHSRRGFALLYQKFLQKIQTLAPNQRSGRAMSTDQLSARNPPGGYPADIRPPDIRRGYQADIQRGFHMQMSIFV